jgi:hypothetical protein
MYPADLIVESTTLTRLLDNVATLKRNNIHYVCGICAAAIIPAGLPVDGPGTAVSLDHAL